MHVIGIAQVSPGIGSMSTCFREDSEPPNAFEPSLSKRWIIKKLPRLPAHTWKHHRWNMKKEKGRQSDLPTLVQLCPPSGGGVHDIDHLEHNTHGLILL